MNYSTKPLNLKNKSGGVSTQNSSQVSLRFHFKERKLKFVDDEIWVWLSKEENKKHQPPDLYSKKRPWFFFKRWFICFKLKWNAQSVYYLSNSLISQLTTSSNYKMREATIPQLFLMFFVKTLKLLPVILWVISKFRLFAIPLCQ